MHYYQFNIADYQSHTRHLSPIEDICYRRMLDWIYLHEKPLPKDPKDIARILILNECLTDVEQVLNEFFTEVEQGWVNVRALSEIDAFNEKLEKASKAGKASAEARKTKVKQSLKDSQQTFNERSTGVQPNNKHKPLNNNQSKGSRLSKDWVLPDEWVLEAKKVNKQLTTESIKTISLGFKDYWVSLAGSKAVKLDWLAVWRNWIRNQKKGYAGSTENEQWKEKML